MCRFVPLPLPFGHVYDPPSGQAQPPYPLEPSPPAPFCHLFHSALLIFPRFCFARVARRLLCPFIPAQCALFFFLGPSLWSCPLLFWMYPASETESDQFLSLTISVSYYSRSLLFEIFLYEKTSLFPLPPQRLLLKGPSKKPRFRFMLRPEHPRLRQPNRPPPLPNHTLANPEALPPFGAFCLLTTAKPD